MSTENLEKSVPEEQVSAVDAAEDVKENPTQEPCQNDGAEPQTTVEAACEPQSDEQNVEAKSEENIAREQQDDHSEVEDAAQESKDDQPAVEKVDFAEEEAELAAASSDFELSDEEGDEQNGGEQEDPAVQADLHERIAGMSKSELVALFASLLESKPIQQLRGDLEAIKVAFYRQHNAEREALKKKFVEQGGVEEEFKAPYDNDEIRLKEYFDIYRHRRADYIENLEQVKEDNLKVKMQIIEDLKELINSNETMNNTFNTFRELQQRWKDTGIVPQANVKELWENYNLQVENFYNYIKINKELRDLDLKRNYEIKLQLCEAAEALVLEPSVVVAFRKLQELHDEWRETGPVANEYKEAVWERFREASSRINKQHQEFYDNQRDEQKRNLELKAELCAKVEELSKEMFTSRKEWNKASDQLIEIQKVWKTIGFAPKKDNTKIYERFRNGCDNFFAVKRAYYDNAKTEMANNLQLKIDICEAAEALKDSEQWKKTTDELIALQKRWKEIGPVARRHSDQVWKRFRAACDSFFERKGSHFAGVDAEHDENLKAKTALLEEIEAADISEGGFDAIKEFQRRWSEIGFVPIKEKDNIQKRYKAAIDELFNTLRSGERGRSMDRYRSKITSIKAGGGDRRLRVERDKLFNKVKQLEQDIATLENNIGFFARSKNADAMVRDVQEKIERTKKEMQETIEKINLIDKEEQ